MKDITKKLGFTLIELLAVIVILAIIALIATPIVMNIIEDSKKGAAERSAENYFKQIETTVANSYSNSANKIKDGVYYIQVDAEGNPTGKIESRLEVINDVTISYPKLKDYSIEINGQKPTDGIIYIRNGQVTNGSFLRIDNEIVNFVNGNGTIYTYGTKTIGSTILYNPVTNSVCDVENISNNCYSWYIIRDNGTEYASISLLLKRNLGDQVEWVTKSDYLANGGNNWAASSTDGNNELGPITANSYLKEITSNWVPMAYLPQNRSETFYAECPVGSEYPDCVFWVATAIGGVGNEMGAYTNGSPTNVDSKEHVRPVISILK